MAIVLNVQIALGSIDILTIFVLPVRDHGRSFHFFVSPSISFGSLLQFSEYTSFIRFFSSHVFNCFGAIANGIDSLIHFSAVLLLVYRSATDFCTLSLYPDTLLNACISSSKFGGKSFGCSPQRTSQSIMSSANSDSFTSSLLFQMLLTPFSCLIPSARTSSYYVKQQW